MDIIVIVGAGPIVIGQACEFDYSGVQACRALRPFVDRLVLLNSNPATIMTDPNLADATYVEPLNPYFLKILLEKERQAFPEARIAVLPTMGGQTALNTTLKVEQEGILKELGIELIGVDGKTIDQAEDREKFKDIMEGLGINCAYSRHVSSLEEALLFLKSFTLPLVIRPSFTLGGKGGGIAYTHQEFIDLVSYGLEASPVHKVLIEECLYGWKEYELEVMRDCEDNAIVVCSIENVDPVGVHTGDSVTVAPALTLTDKEYQEMRSEALRAIRGIGHVVGGANVQFAVHPETGRRVIIEINPRVSRSSALASKATGLPIAKVAALLALGKTLAEIPNDVTKTTSAGFEPMLDYVVLKIPRFSFDKFPNTPIRLTTSMKSVGEVMAIGRSFKEALQKALVALEVGISGLDEVVLGGGSNDHAAMVEDLSVPVPLNLLKVAQAFRAGLSRGVISSATRIDPWFLDRIEELVKEEEEIRSVALESCVFEDMLRFKQDGFSDRRLAYLFNRKEEDVRSYRLNLGVRPIFRMVDTCAGEFDAVTSYFYSTYEAPVVGSFPEVYLSDKRLSLKKKAVVLGGGPNRIGQGIEFDYCCVHSAQTFSEYGYESIMINSNPETVSTDYDVSDRLYFEPLTVEHVMNVLDQEGDIEGVVVQLGGQTPIRLVPGLERYGVKMLGSSSSVIDQMEDRDKFSVFLSALGVKQSENGVASTRDEALKIAERIGYPVIVRPSYVLGGRCMEVLDSASQLLRYMEERNVAGDTILIDHFLDGAVEVDVDLIADGESVFVAGVMQHIEEAGVHSGDSACVFPPHSLSTGVIDRIVEVSKKLALASVAKGFLNIQFALLGEDIYVLEVNPRASRTVPFIAKALGIPLVRITTCVMMGGKLKDFGLPERYLQPAYFYVKEAVFPFSSFTGTDTLLGPEMLSTGEVMGVDKTFPKAFAKSQLGAGWSLPLEGVVFVSVKDKDKPFIVDAVRCMHTLGFKIYATVGTRDYLVNLGFDVKGVKKVKEGSPNIVEMMANGEVHLVFNTVFGAQEIRDSFSIRATALRYKIPYYTTVSGIIAVSSAIQALKSTNLEVYPLQVIYEEKGGAR